jgi:hypothetical protein
MILIDIPPHSHGVVTLQKSIHSLWCSHPNITCLVSLSTSTHSLDEDTFISHLNLLSPSLLILFEKFIGDGHNQYDF